MKSKDFFSFNVRANTIDLTTKDVNDSNKGYLVDQKLIDLLIGNLIGKPLEEVKAEIADRVLSAECISQIQKILEENLYLHILADKIYQAMPERYSTEVDI